MRFYVNKEDISEGIKGDCDKCPVALAVKRKLGRRRYIAVGNLYLHIGKNTFELPVMVKKFITFFDSRSAVKPFSFSIPNLERIMQ